MRYFTSDTHFGHKNAIEYDRRPFSSLDEMEFKIIDNWNNVVKRDDIVYHLGDFSFGSPKKAWDIIRLLNGHIRLIRGNHDLWNGYTAKRCIDNLGRPYFNDIGDIETIMIDGIQFVLSHYPYTETRFPQMCPKNVGNVLIHGHSHTHTPIWHDNQINVSCCLWDYTPVSEKKIIQLVMENL